MVATILKNVTTKGIEAAAKTSSSSTAANNSNANSTASASSSSSFFADNKTNAIKPHIDINRNNVEIEDGGYYDIWSKYASDAFTSTRDTIYSASDEASKQMFNMASSVYSPNPKDMGALHVNEFEDKQNVGVSNTRSTQKSSENTSMPRKWFMTNDPYNIVTGRSHLPPTHHRKSVMAVRNLLELVDIDEANEPASLWERKSMRIIDEGSGSTDSSMNLLDDDSLPGSCVELHGGATTSDEFSSSGRPKRKISKAETASRLSEGTVRAMRDMALNEALELHHALRFWTARLERPVLFYMEVGPRWWSKDGHHHADVGQKVSQIQAVLARRCSSIGQLQQHLWRAGWSSGVEQWGILGQGEWAAVVGGHGLIDDNQGMGFENRSSSKDTRKGNKKDYYAESHLFVKNVRGGRIVRNDAALAAWSIDAIRVVRDQLYSAGSGRTPLPKFENWPREFRHFGKDTEKEDRQSNAGLWDSMISIDGRSVFEDDDEDALDIPIWATYDVGHETLVTNERSLTIPNSEGESDSQPELEDFLPSSPEPQYQDFARSKPEKSQVGDFVISDLGLMAAEVTEILDSMETYMDQQRKRRLDKLKPPPRILRNWYFIAIGIPVAGYVAYNLTRENRGVKIAKEFYQQTISFCAEHISEPLQSIYRELFTGRVDVADHKAREDVISILQKMIKSWLDEVFPDMPESERIEKATKMDMSLIESQKEYSIKNILEISNIYRLSLIEMQFIKKEMMNALVAIDELMGSNEINMQLAAMTPAFLLASSIRHTFGKLYYAFLKLGKSKEETYASFRHIILDIERLLVMRDNPPPSIPPLSTGVNGLRSSEIDLSGSDEHAISQSAEVLSSDDLGMLMLLVHDCRVILWQNRKRFSRSELRNVSEDLAELAGERGAVSIRQQLRIISRMCRTYSFLKIISSGVPFSVDA